MKKIAVESYKSIPMYLLFLLTCLNTYCQDFDESRFKQELVNYGYTDSLVAASEIVRFGENAIPLLESLLEQKQTVAIGSQYPFNVIWALARIGGSKAKAILNNHLDLVGADLALKAIVSRERLKTKEAGILYVENKSLLEKPDHSSGEVEKVHRGIEVMDLGRVENLHEEGPRGGNQVYLKLKIVGTSVTGYLPLDGIAFDPYY